MNSETHSINSGQAKTCQNCKKSFVIESEDFGFYEKMNVPPPTFCWKCRFQRRLVWRNERVLFRSKSAKSGKDILTITPPGSGIPVYDQKEWWSDDWDPMDYGREFDKSRSFFEQFGKLAKSVPIASRNVTPEMVNSEYSANSGFLKNCYLLFNSTSDEDCSYGAGVNQSRNCLDNSNIDKCERCYQSFWINNCHKTHFSVQCTDCVGAYLCKNCRGCTDCFGCANLTNKQYHIFNVPYSKEEYQKKMTDFNLDSWTSLTAKIKEAHNLWLRFPNKYIQGVRNVDVTGAYVTDSKNVKYGYLVRESEDCKYCQYLQDPNNKNLYDITIWGGNLQLSYEVALCGYGTVQAKFCVNCWDEVRDIEYSFNCMNSSHLFGCVGLRKKQYCILNRQYSEEEFFKIREEIISQMNLMPYMDKKGRVYKYGEFFPIEISPYGYNNTLALEHFPLKKEEILENGYIWIDNDKSEYAITKRASDLPDSIKDVPDGILNEVIECSDCGKAFRIIKDELSFLRGENIPLPRTCFECRNKSRLTNRNPAFLYGRECDCAGGYGKAGIYRNAAKHRHGEGKCPNKFETSYSPERKEIVYCEQCYQAEVV